MKRFVGLVLTITGVAVLFWVGGSTTHGSLSTRIPVTPDFSITALTGGLAGLASFTAGLVWMRD